MKNFKLKARIIEKFGTQADFARLIGMQEQRISRFIHGRTMPNEAERQQISRRLGVAQGEIFSTN